MAYEQGGFTYTRVAGGDLSALQYHFVKLNASGQVVAITAITDRPAGVLQNDPLSGEAATIMGIGISKLVADGTITAGNELGTSVDGQADAIASGTDTTVYKVGEALADAAAGEKFPALINCLAPTRAA